MGVHINSVKDKVGKTYFQGKNPFDYLAFGFSEDGFTKTYYEHDGREWKTYKDIPPIKLSNVPKYKWGKSEKLSNWVKVYDWANDGYNSFPSWLDEAS